MPEEKTPKQNEVTPEQEEIINNVKERNRLTRWFANNADIITPVGSIGSFMAGIGAVVAIVFAGIQFSLMTDSNKLQKEIFYLEKRPYLYVNLVPDFGYNDQIKDVFGGGNVVFKNVGQIPASNIETTFNVGTERGEINLKDWFVKELGGFPEVKTVFSQDINSIFIHPQIGKDTRFFYLDVLVTYSGHNTDNKYWYKFTQVYNVYWDGKKLNKTPIKTDTDWDRNIDIDPAPVAIIDCNNFKDFLGSFLENET